MDNDCDYDAIDGIADDDGDDVLDGAGSDGDLCSSGTDCDDTDPLTRPGASEVCRDGIDQDCDHIVDGITSMLSGPVMLSSSTRLSDAAVGWSGSEYGVAWYDDLSRNLLFSRISAAGAPTGTSTTISTNARTTPRSLVGLSWSGTEWGVVWSNDYYTGGDADVYFNRLSPEGAKMLGSDLAVASGSRESEEASIAWNTSQYGIVWTEIYSSSSNRVVFARVSPAGARIGSNVLLNTAAAALAWQPSIAAAGADFGIAWSDYRAGTEGEIYYRRVSMAGAPAPSDVNLTSSTSAGDVSPSLAWSGTELGLMWIENRTTPLPATTVMFARLTISGVERMSDPIHGEGSFPAVVWAGSEYGTAWSTSMTGVIFDRLAADGSEFASNVQIGAGTDRPQLAWSGSEFGITYFLDSTDTAFYFDILGYCD
jgi:hypothetical protein